MIDLTCVHVSSVMWNALGGALVLLLSTRGTDEDGVPSVFFLEITLARILLCATWALVHLLHALFESRATHLVVPNTSIDGTRVAVLLATFTWHRRWSTGDGWKLLRSRFVRPILWRWLMFGTALTGIGATANSCIVWHHPGEAQYVENIVYQCVCYIGCFCIIYVMRRQFCRGNVWLVLSLGCVLNSAFSGLTLLVSVLLHSVPLPDPFGMLGQAVFWLIIALLGFRFHAEIRPSIESPRNLGMSAPQPNLEAPLKDASSPAGSASVSIVTVVPFGGDHNQVPSMAQSPLPSPSSAWPEQAPLSASFAQETSVEMSSFGHAPLASAREHVSLGSESAVSDSTSDSIASSISDAVSDDVATAPPLDLNLDDACIVAPSDVVQMHKLVVSLVELFVFTGTAYASESIVRLAYPALPFCAQFDPTRASWLDFLRSIFDLFST